MPAPVIETHWHMSGAVARKMAGLEEKTGYFPLGRVLGCRGRPRLVATTVISEQCHERSRENGPTSLDLSRPAATISEADARYVARTEGDTSCAGTRRAS